MNIIFDDGTVCTLLHPTTDDGPGGLILGSGFRFNAPELGIYPGTTAELREGTIRVGEVLYDTRGSEAFDCRMIDGHELPTATEILRMYEALGNARGFERSIPSDDDIATELASREQVLARSLIGESDLEIEGSAARLVGFGYGLTPSGDDFITGCMAALRYLGGDDSEVLEALASAAVSNASNTTSIGAWMLRSAAEGCFRGHLRAVLPVLRTGNREQVETATDAVLGFGASSGHDMLDGVAAVLKARCESLKETID